MSAEFLPGQHVELLETGRDYFPALLAAIAASHSEIHLETYIFAADDTGQRIAAALAAAARRGVAVRVLVDGFGARDFPEEFGQALEQAGVRYAIYRAEAGRWLPRRHRLRRLHRKLAVIDARIAFVGGINIIDDLNNGDTAGLGPRFDYAVQIAGPLVMSIHASVRQLWRLVTWAQRRHRPPRLPLPPGADTAPGGDMLAAFVVRDNLRHRRAIEDAYLDAIASARAEIFLANAYFLPGRRFRRALREAAARGVRITILLQGRVEYALQHYATRALYRNLLENGVRIVEYHAGFLHAKVAVIDGHWATVGSSNIDPFSLLLAREANIVVRNARFAGHLREKLELAARRHATAISLTEFRRSPLFERGLRWLAYGLVRLLIGLTRYGGNDYRE